MTDPLSPANYDNTKEILRETSEQPANEVLTLRFTIVGRALGHLESVVPHEPDQFVPGSHNAASREKQPYWQEAA